MNVKILFIWIIKELKRSQASRLLSTTRLNTLLHLHLWPIKPVFYWKSSDQRKGNLILGWASHLYAFSAYPCQT